MSPLPWHLSTLGQGIYLHKVLADWQGFKVSESNERCFGLIVAFPHSNGCRPTGPN